MTLRNARHTVMTLFFLLIAAICNPCVVRLLAGGGADRRLELTNQIFLWLLSGGFLLVAAIVYFAGRTVQGRKKIIFGCAMAILMIMMVELSLHVGLWTIGLMQHARTGKVPRLLLHSGYKDKVWATQSMKEWKDTVQDFEPFTGWRRRPYKGKYVNIDSQGVRKTWNPDFSGVTPRTVYMFGGSTIWGGFRDDSTIPSHVSKKLNAAGAKYEVHNYGESAYVVLQEVVLLTLLLREGYRPDYVIFYDGVNDVYAAYQSGRADGLQNMSHIKATFDRGRMSPWVRNMAGLKRSFENHCLVYRVIDLIADALEGRGRQREVASSYNEKKVRRLALEVVEQYDKSVQLLDILSKAYGFKYFCFWQPVAFLEDKLTREEKGSDPKIKDEGLASLCREVYALQRQRLSNVRIDLTGVFRNRTQSVYVDFCHVTEEGNAAVADKIVDLIKPILDGDQNKRDSNHSNTQRISIASP